MKHIFLSAIAVLCLIMVPSSAKALSWDQKLACEAILCLSSGERPSECGPSLDRYFGINPRKNVIAARREFLRLCPTATYDPNMIGLTDSISEGAGRCDASTLNATLGVWVAPSVQLQTWTWPCDDSSCTYEVCVGTHNQYQSFWERTYNKSQGIGSGMPGYCVGYHGHAYTDLPLPRYIGTPERGGFWAEPDTYERALNDYNARVIWEDNELERLRGEVNECRNRVDEQRRQWPWRP